MSDQKTFASSVGEKAQQVAKEDFGKVKAVTGDAVKSGAYLYPIRGIVYFVTHRALWKPLASRIIPTLTLSAAVLTGMFVFTYLPQLAVLVFVNGPLAPFTTIILILNESSTIINMVSRGWLLQDAILDTFDGTLVEKNDLQLVEGGRELKKGKGLDGVARLGRVLKSPFERFSLKSMVRYFMYLPLNFIPVVGTGIFIMIQARNRGRAVHQRYFQLKKWNQSQIDGFLNEHTGPYTAFGAVATLLELIPFASILFNFTNTVGAALWAADIEAKGTAMTKTTAPDLRKTAEKAE